MKISIVSGTGSGATKLAAFDAALRDAGIANHNLIRLSSIIPPDTELVREKDGIELQLGSWGDRLYVVFAEQRADTANTDAWAGIGWVTDLETNKGLFVEHEGTKEADVRQDIHDTLTSMMVGRSQSFGSIEMEVRGITCSDKPVCALVAAVYQTEPW